MCGGGCWMGGAADLWLRFKCALHLHIQAHALWPWSHAVLPHGGMSHGPPAQLHTSRTRCLSLRRPVRCFVLDPPPRATAPAPGPPPPPPPHTPPPLCRRRRSRCRPPGFPGEPIACHIGWGAGAPQPPCPAPPRTPPRPVPSRCDARTTLLMVANASTQGRGRSCPAGRLPWSGHHARPVWLAGLQAHSPAAGQRPTLSGCGRYAPRSPNGWCGD